MGAVQLLRSSADNQVSNTHASVPPPDYHKEASHFKEKLIQVNSVHSLFLPEESNVNYLGGGNAWRTNGVQLSSSVCLQAAERFADRLRTELVPFTWPFAIRLCR